ncbi:hypothetical protein V5O48_008447 [Marasmius crinis-equi]|uniref:MYND-type domain-containing protein n=1 Tax=Marasmius crinis-equi TaxID=585013 RepID=A0ABR3FEB8_9AGAR
MSESGLDSVLSISAAEKRFPTVTKAIKHLKKIGKPPAQVDISYPSSVVHDAVQVVVALSYHAGPGPRASLASVQIRAEWSSSSLLSEWITFLIGRIILASELPTTTEGSDLFHACVLDIPVVLTTPDGDNRNIKHMAPNLQPLVTQAWFVLLERDHYAYPRWVTALRGLIHSGRSVAKVITDANFPIRIAEDAHLGAIILGHLRARVPAVPKMDRDRLVQFKCHINLITAEPCFQGNRIPLHEASNIRGFARVLVDILSAVLYKRKALRATPIDTFDARTSHDLMLLVSSAITHLPHNVLVIEEILDAGVVQAIFRADVAFFRMDDARDVEDPSARFSGWGARIFDMIAQYLFHDSVLRRFVRIANKIMESEENHRRIKARSEWIWVAWNQAADKVTFLHSIRTDLKRLTTLCCYLQCPAVSGKSLEGKEIKYVRCLGCSSTVYCSAACQRAHWKSEHGAECPVIAKARRNAIPFVTHSNLMFFRKCIESYAMEQAHNLTKLVQSYQPKQTSSKGRLPILFINFNIFGTPARSDVEIFDDHSAKKMESRYLWDPEWTASVLKRWNDADPANIVITANFPRSKSSPLPLMQTMKFPFQVVVKAKATQLKTSAPLEGGNRREVGFNAFEGENIDDVLD